MEHPFFRDINWDNLSMKLPTGKYIPEKPKFKISDYSDLIKESNLTELEI
jgi:hypothetical protein